MTRGSDTRHTEAIATTAELVSAAVQERTIHGWHSSRLLMWGGTLYAAATHHDPHAGNAWSDRGIIYRRSGNGRWDAAGHLGTQPYHMMVDPRGRFWVIAPSDPRTCAVFRSAPGADLSRWDLVYTGTSAYVGASVSAGGDVLIIHSDGNRPGPAAIVAAFYSAAGESWHISRLETPEWRYGYEAIFLDGARALAILNSSAAPPPEGHKTGKPVMSFWDMEWGEEATPWRHIRLAVCDDLTRGEWRQHPYLIQPWGWTGLLDVYAGPDGRPHLLYAHRGGQTREAYEADRARLYLARIGWDLDVQTTIVDREANRAKFLVDTARGRWFLVDGSDDGLFLSDVDLSGGGLRLTNERVLAGTRDRLTGYVLHTLRPQRFGGEEDPDRFHMLGVRSAGRSGDANAVPLELVSFAIP